MPGRIQSCAIQKRCKAAHALISRLLRQPVGIYHRACRSELLHIIWDQIQPWRRSTVSQSRKIDIQTNKHQWHGMRCLILITLQFSGRFQGLVKSSDRYVGVRLRPYTGERDAPSTILRELHRHSLMASTIPCPISSGISLPSSIVESRGLTREGLIHLIIKAVWLSSLGDDLFLPLSCSASLSSFPFSSIHITLAAVNQEP